MVGGKQTSIIEISRSKLSNNVKFLGKIAGKPIMAVVKANAYGHGLKEVVSILDKCPEINSFAVDSLGEAVAVNDLSLKQTLIIGHLTKSEIVQAVQLNIPFVLHSLEQLNDLKDIKNNIPVHLKLETGTNRLGFQEKNTPLLVDSLMKQNNIIIKGVYTHFSDLEEGDLNYANQQLATYNNMLRCFKTANIDYGVCHTASTASAIILPESRFDQVRCGIGLYGYWPSNLIKDKFEGQDELQPILTWKSQIVEIKNIESGESVGYGRSYVADKTHTIGILPIGYSDGYPRALSNNCYVVFEEQKLPVIGRVAMNMMMIDCTDVDVSVGEWVEIISPNITADYLADRSNTINYEILARLSANINRRIVD